MGPKASTDDSVNVGGNGAQSSVFALSVVLNSPICLFLGLRTPPFCPPFLWNREQKRSISGLSGTG